MIGYRRGGRYFMRTAPEKVNQSEATKAAGRLFGAASACGKYIREAVMPALDISYDTSVVNRLNSLLYREALTNPDWKDLSTLTGFSFSRYTRLGDILRGTPRIQRDYHGNILVLLDHPGSLNKTPPKATHIAIKAIAMNPAQRKDAVATEPVLIDLRNPPQELTLTIPYAAQDAAAVILEVIFVTKENGVHYPIRNRRFYAAEVVSVIETVAAKPKRSYGRPGIKKLHGQAPARTGRKKGGSPPRE